MKVTKVILEKDDPEKGQRLATGTVAFDGTVVVSGFAIFPDRKRPERLRVLFPVRKFGGETTETFSVLDPILKAEIVAAIESACEEQGIKAGAAK